MDNIIILESCGDGECYCLTPRSAVVFISMICLVASLIDAVSNESDPSCCEAHGHLDSMKNTLATLFQMANMVLLLASILESALLLQLYLWYALGFIVLGFVVTIVDFLLRYQNEGPWSLIDLVSQVSFLFVTFRCLPIVDVYRKRLEGT